MSYLSFLAVRIKQNILTILYVYKIMVSVLLCITAEVKYIFEDRKCFIEKAWETKHFVLSRPLSFSLGCSSSLKPSWIVVLFKMNACCTIVSIFFNPFPWHVKNLPSQRILCEITNNQLPVIVLQFVY